MSKRKSTGAQNTLLNYFSKSPASGAIKNSPLSTKAAEGNTSKCVKRELSLSASDSSDSEKEIKISKKKRQRILENSSDSDGSPKLTGEVLKSKEIKIEKKADIKLDIKNSATKVKDKSSELETAEKTLPKDQQVTLLHERLEFLKPENIKDKKGRRPSDPNYDSSTLYVPEKFLAGLTPGVRQWWDFKTDHFDCVLFFKVGKFYELYNMDAFVGINELGCTLMKGDFAHSGFPEVSYDKMCFKLIEKGYKVARVEQTETPDMMTERCRKQAVTTKFDRVVKREICQITNIGTQLYTPVEDVAMNHIPNYMMAIVEQDKGRQSTFGICFIDTTIGDFFIGQFDDDTNSSRLLTLLSHNFPALVLLEKHGNSSRTQQIAKTILGNVVKESLYKKTQFWDAEKTMEFLWENYYPNKKSWPQTLSIMQDENDHLGLTPKEDYKLALKALGGCIWYMKRCFIDQQVLSMCRYHHFLPPDMKTNIAQDIVTDKKASMPQSGTHKFMVLDYVVLKNLGIIDQGMCLLTKLDNCCTQFGRRLLHYWICSPSCDVKIIRARQDGIQELLRNPSILQEACELLNTLPDFERYLTRIHTLGSTHNLENHPNNRAILFEDKQNDKKKIQEIISLLSGFKSLVRVPEIFATCESQLLMKLTQFAEKGKFPNLRKPLEYFQNAFNHEKALKEGIIAPEEGIDADYDAATSKIALIEKELQEYLTAQEKFFGCRLSYVGNDKKRYQIEVPEGKAMKAGSEYTLESQKKGSQPVKRFHTSETREFLKKMMKAEDERTKILKDISRRIFEKFSSYYCIWKQCVDSIANLDVLISLAMYSQNQTVICAPVFVEETDNPFIEIEEGYLPVLPSFENYVPNGISIGGSNNGTLVILTGPNMGGKSTLMRQIGLLAVMAQIGCLIPAASCRLSLIDRIFTRLGAQDDIISGSSTFLVELNETSSILKHATSQSLVLMDELGRGTSTYDGTAVAASIVHFLIPLKCRTLFSTHYYSLVDRFKADQNVSFGHMACALENENTEDPSEENVTFLYKYVDGACPKSYGFNVAKLCDMPRPIIKRAFELSNRIQKTALMKNIVTKILLNEDISEKLRIFKLQ